MKKSLHNLFPKEKNPQLYSKRGLESKRIKGIIIPKSTGELAYVIDTSGNKIII